MDASVRSRSLILSVLIHTALLLLLLFIVMRSPIPPFVDSDSGGGRGVLVIVGNAEEAMGDVRPMSSVVTKEPTPVKPVPSPPAEENKLATQNTEESYAMEEARKKNIKRNETKVVKPVVTPVKEPVKPIEKPRTAEEGSTYKGKSNNSKSQGTASTGTGIQGSKDGDPQGKYSGKSGTGGGTEGGTGGGTGGGNGPGTGSGNGPGISFELGNRILKVKPSIDDRSQETGKVVVAITVDKAGNVTAALPGVRGSTTTSAYLFGKAKEAALKAKFNADPNGNDIQKGTMTFVFLVH